LDNARDAEQVRPLLPGAPGCLAVVTSRDRLSALVIDGAHPLTLDLLSSSEARELLARRLGSSRVSTQPHAVEQVITLCARLPLALAIVAARAATHPGFSLTALADELHETRDNLDTFAGTDPAVDARAVFSWSYRQLSSAAATLFRLLGLHPGPDIAGPAAASLAGLPPSQVRPLLAELAGTHLITEHIPGRYTFHDLLRAYAAELARTREPDTERRAATHRMLGHYSHSGDAADRLFSPHRKGFPAPPLPPGVTPEKMSSLRQAMAWFDAEHPVLIAAVRHAAGFDAEVWHLGWTLGRYLAHQGPWHELIAGHALVDALIEAGGLALNAAQRMADPLRQAFVHRILGGAYIRQGNYDDARPHLQAAIDLCRRGGDNVGEAYAHYYHSWMLYRQNRHQEGLLYLQQALDLFRGGGDVGEADAHHYYSWMLQKQKRRQEAVVHAQQALDLYLVVGDRYGQAKVLTSIGWFHSLSGDHEQALRYGRQALDLQEAIDDRYGQAETRTRLGYAHRHLGHHAQAITCYQAATALYREVNDRYQEAVTSDALGDIHHAGGDTVSAGAAWQHALTILDQLDHIDADQVRAKLEELADPDERHPPAQVSRPPPSGLSGRQNFES
jgi:tetratricopeptide (TPR) repeat protein